MDKTTLIIPAYFVNQSFVKMTNDCVKSIGDEVDEVVVVDDGSPIHPDSMFDKNRPSRRLLRRVDNGGYSVAVNDGLRAAQGNIIIIGNNDLIFPENWLTGLLFPLNVGFDISTCWTSDQKDIVLHDKIESGAKFGSLFAMKRVVHETIGGFDEQFKGYFSDTDYWQRATNTGFKIGKNLNLVVEHKAKATYKITDPDDSEYELASRLFEAKHGFLV